MESTNPGTNETSVHMGRATIRQHAERSAPHEKDSVLLQGHVAHLGFREGDQVFVIPFTYHYDAATPDRIYLHGGQSSRALDVLATGAPVCVEVTILDGLVYSRDALYHSVNYRSCVCFGRAREVVDTDRKREILRDMITRYFPQRHEGTHYAAPSAAQIDATALFEVNIEECSTKVRTGGPKGPHDANEGELGSCGVLDLKTELIDRPNG